VSISPDRCSFRPTDAFYPLVCRPRAVVAADVDDQRVVELAHVLDGLDHPANLVVRIREVHAVHIGLLDEELLLLPKGVLRFLPNHEVAYPWSFRMVPIVPVSFLMTESYPANPVAASPATP
jgi:hypothetical protein